MRRRVRDFALRISGLFRRGGMEQRLDSEMRFHLDMLTEKNIRAGVEADEARRLALAAFGGAERFKDDARDEYRSQLVDELVQDVRYALRVMRRNPGFAIAAALTFALGIGASTAMFSVVHGVLLRPLPYADPGRLVVLWERNVARGSDHNVVGVSTFEAWRERARSFDGMAGLVPLPATIAGAPTPERVMGAEVSPGYFRLLGVPPALGREFSAEEERSGGADVLVLSDGFWRSHFAARSHRARSHAVDRWASAHDRRRHARAFRSPAVRVARRAGVLEAVRRNRQQPIVGPVPARDRAREAHGFDRGGASRVGGHRRATGGSR